VKYDQPVPDNIEWQKEIKDVGRVKDARLKSGQERDTGIIVRVPERKLKALEQLYPKKFGGDKKGSEISLTENDFGRKHGSEIQQTQDKKHCDNNKVSIYFQLAEDYS